MSEFQAQLQVVFLRLGYGGRYSSLHTKGTWPLSPRALPSPAEPEMFRKHPLSLENVIARSKHRSARTYATPSWSFQANPTFRFCVAWHTKGSGEHSNSSVAHNKSHGNTRMTGIASLLTQSVCWAHCFARSRSAREACSAAVNDLHSRSRTVFTPQSWACDCNSVVKSGIFYLHFFSRSKSFRFSK